MGERGDCMKPICDPETLFCSYYLSRRNVREAASLAGLPGGEPEGYRLLEKRRVQNRLTQPRSEPLLELAQAGLRRLAFGSNADGVRLALSTPEQALAQLEGWDLFGVSAIKRGKDGLLEVQFYNRFDALELLCRLGQEQEQAKDGLSFCRALEHAAGEEEG